jgi:hypothetical protein
MWNSNIDPTLTGDELAMLILADGVLDEEGEEDY